MERGSRILVPLFKNWSTLSTLHQPTRTFFSHRYLTPFTWKLENHFHDIERQFERIEHDLFGSNILNRARGVVMMPFNKSTITPMTIYESNIPGKYQINVNIGEGITPENIKVSLMDRVIKIEAKYEYMTQDGNSSISQEYMKQFTLPDNVNPTEVKSIYLQEGILQIEAPLPLPPSSSPEVGTFKEIPIKIEQSVDANAAAK